MRDRRILTSLVSLVALSAAPALAGDLSANTSHTAGVITVSTGYVKVDTLIKTESSKVQTSKKWKERNSNKVLILGGPEVIPM